MKTPLYNIDPARPLADRIAQLEHATLVPITQGPRRARLGGVLDNSGQYVENSACFIDENRRPTLPPDPKQAKQARYQAGTWLFGGRYGLRFGHFLVETTARLWALDHVDDAVDGVVFLPATVRLPANPKRRVRRARHHLYDLFNNLPDPMLATTPIRFEELIVPPQGGGAGQLSVGCPEHRQFSRQRFSKNFKQRGSRKLYLSRSKLSGTPGQIVAEEHLEKTLSDCGYDIFHPQDHSIIEQIERIKAAEIGVEGSAFHLVAYAAQQNCKIGIIRRRLDEKGIVAHCELHPGRTSDLNAITETFVVGDEKHPTSNAVLSFSKLYDQLKENGFVPSKTSLKTLSNAELNHARLTLEKRILTKCA